jgi:beta-glucosidase
MTLSKPAIVAEFEKQADAIVVNFGVQDQALLDILSGVAEPSGLLPVQMPANMKTVEEQKEDVPHDMECYVDSEGHKYDFGYGLNWQGIINDARTMKYKNVSKAF